VTRRRRANEKGRLAPPQFTSVPYRFLLFFFLDDFALRFLAICFPLPVKERTFRTFGERESNRRE
jgi:hypothetical protein